MPGAVFPFLPGVYQQQAGRVLPITGGELVGGYDAVTSGIGLDDYITPGGWLSDNDPIRLPEVANGDRYGCQCEQRFFLYLSSTVLPNATMKFQQFFTGIKHFHLQQWGIPLRENPEFPLQSARL